MQTLHNKAWPRVKIVQVSKVIMGQAPPGENYNTEGLGIPLIAGAGDLGDSSPHPARWTTSVSQLCKPGDLIYCIRATIGEMNWADKEYCLGRGVAAIRANTESQLDTDLPIEPDYLYYWLIANKELLASMASGSTFIQLRRQDIEDTYIPYPPLPEQRRIVAILREADRLRQLRRAADEKAQQVLQAIFYEMFGDPVMNPKGWEITNLDSISNRITDGTHQPPPFTEDGIPFLFVSNIMNGEIDLNTDKHISRETYEILMKRCPVEQGDILYSTVGSYGVAVVVETDEPFSFQRHIAHIKPDHARVNSFFLCSMLNSPYVKAQAEQRVRGIAQGTLNLGEIAEFLMYVPPLDLQQKFMERGKIYQRTKSHQQAGNLHLDTLFQSLLAQAFTGELTAVWRERHAGLLQPMSVETELLESLLDEEEEEEQALVVDVPNVSRPELVRMLSGEQRQLLAYIQEIDGYCTQETLYADLQKLLPGDALYRLPHYTIQQGLQLFAQVGLVQVVSLPDRPVSEVVYVPAYRRLIEGDRAQELDMDVLRSKLEREVLE